MAKSYLRPDNIHEIMGSKFLPTFWGHLKEILLIITCVWFKSYLTNTNVNYKNFP